MCNNNAPGLVFEDPPVVPGGRRSRILTDELLAQIKANPGRWARLPERASASLAGAWRSRHPGLDVTARNVDKTTNKATIYVRWVGEDA